MKKRNKQSIYLLLGILALIGMIGGITYSFFNYTRTGATNVIKVGNIEFSSNYTNVTLNSIFPISRNDVDNNANVETITVNIAGKTTYTDGIEYLVSLTDIYAPFDIPVSLIVTANNLGDEDNKYFANRGSTDKLYKVIANETMNNNEPVIVGFIPSSEIETIGQITIKAYVDADNIVISDSYNNGNTPTDYLGTPIEFGEGKTILTTEEWNNLKEQPISFKIKLEANEGIWANDPLGAYGIMLLKSDDNATINFGANSSSSNGNGVYLLPGTENMRYPLYYYRGDVTDNNVIFNGFCWQMLHTTKTGGVKMIYNGEATGDGTTCENTSHASRIISSNSFNVSYNSMSNVGYKHNEGYNWGSSRPQTEAYFGEDIEYGDFDHNGTQEYRLISGRTSKTLDDTHHYSCNLTYESGTCSQVRYYYYNSGSTYRYIVLENGDLLDDALYKMTGNGNNQTKMKNIDYNLNLNDSTMKIIIDKWFKENLTNEIDITKIDYHNYLEDTVYCNDRSYQTQGEGRLLNSGWNPNGGSLITSLSFGSASRFNNNNWYSTTNVPNMDCPNIIDKFTVSSNIGNGALTYPVGLLTMDEAVLAGANGNNITDNNSYYLYTGGNYWTMSPSMLFYSNDANEYYFNSTGRLGSNSANSSYGIRPVISLKPGLAFRKGGEGTRINPYVVEEFNN